MPAPRPTRRAFTRTAGLAALAIRLPAQIQPQGPTRLNLAELERTRILAAAGAALARKPTPDGNLEGEAFLNLTLDIPALAAACLVDDPNAQRYSDQAAAHLEAWFLNPATRPTLTLGTETYEPLIALAPLAESAVAIPFLTLRPALRTRINKAFAQYITFLTTDRTALLARDANNHHASGWLLQVAAFARLTGDDATLTEARHRFKTRTLRTQVEAGGLFPHELTGPTPYRDSLFNLDLLAGICVLLSTRFESLWDTELQDGPGMRAVIARFAPYIARRAAWPYPSDQTLFAQLPCRRPALLFAARAYAQPDYATLWRDTTPAQPTDATLLRTFPIRQPILWQTQPRPTHDPA